ncbi:CYTH-like domain-containing protein [Hysterangium stoloniferum]|nr:CYTH-like domain-containing protein [Hysterangium stoloniferum]
MHRDNSDDDENEEEVDEEDDDFVPRRRQISDEEEDEPASKRARYSPSAPNGYARASPPAPLPPPQPAVPSRQHPQPQPQPQLPLPQRSGRPALEHSILNVEPSDEFIREIADFIHHYISNHTENVEIEAKIGVLKDSSGARLQLPVRVETTLNPDFPGLRFESNMTVGQHRNYNTLLNKLGSPQDKSETVPRTPLKYSHTKLLDQFYPSDNSHDKLRVTIDESTKRVVQCIKKVRLGDINVYSPKRHVDWRVSVNLEIPSPHPTGSPIYSRHKDRMSYSHQYCNIDLTQVRHIIKNDTEILHELELEFNQTAMPVLLSAASRRDASDSEFDELIRIFVNNARILARNASNPALEGAAR